MQTFCGACEIPSLHYIWAPSLQRGSPTFSNRISFAKPKAKVAALARQDHLLRWLRSPRLKQANYHQLLVDSHPALTAANVFALDPPGLRWHAEFGFQMAV
jgi:hypothetical protein